jgi:hypothetical protein
VRSVRLYETGVGYFERAGRLAPGSDTISLPASKVDDVLKTLVVLSDGAPVTVSSVEFPSVLSEALARVQAGLPAGNGQRLSYPILLESLRGTTVEVSETDGRKIVGRLVDVSEVQASDKPRAGSPAAAPEVAAAPPVPPALPRYAVTLLASERGLVRLDSAHISGIRPTDPALAARLDSALGTATERGAQAPRCLKLSATGDARVRIGYIAETPVWRVTYRLLLGKDDAPATLQGWVLVHNDGDEPWQNVALEIVNGRPDSFLYPLTAPRYLRRSLATPEEEMSTLPQLASRTVDQIWGDHAETSGEEDGEVYGAGGLGLSGIGEGGGGTGQGYGDGHGSLGGRSNSSSATSEIRLGNLASIAQSEGVPSGADFRYRMREPITLGAHSSALVPFTQVALGAEVMTRVQWDESQGRSSAKISNSSSQTLPAGPLAIYAASGLAGETALARLVAGQDTWLSYGADLDVEVEKSAALVDTSSTELVRFDARRGLIEHYVRHREQLLQLENRSVLARKVCIELPVIDNAKVQGADRLLYDGRSHTALALFALKPRSQQSKKLVFDEGLQKYSALGSLKQEQLTELASGKGLDPATRAVLLEAADFVAKHAEPQKQHELKQASLERLEKDRQRLEQTIEKLTGTSGNGAEPLVRRLIELEAQRNRLEAEKKALADAEAQRLPALAAILERLNPTPAKAEVSR